MRFINSTSMVITNSQCPCLKCHQVRVGLRVQTLNKDTSPEQVPIIIIIVIIIIYLYNEYFLGGQKSYYSPYPSLAGMDMRLCRLVEHRDAFGRPAEQATEP